MAFVDFEQRGPIGVITMNRPEAQIGRAHV